MNRPQYKEQKDITEYSDKELSLLVFNTEELYKHVELFCEVIKTEDGGQETGLRKNVLKNFSEALSAYKSTAAQWKVLREDILQHYREEYHTA